MAALITDALNKVAREAHLSQPGSWLTSDDEDHRLIADAHLPNVAEEILDRVDLPSPVGGQTTITGDGSEDYSLPAGFRRLQRDNVAVYETTTTRRAGIPVSDDGIWTHIKEIGVAGAYRYYRLQGYPGAFTIGFYENPTSDVEIIVAYVSNNWIVNAGTYKDTFSDPADELLLPRRVVELGCLWRFRKDKGLRYDDVEAEYQRYVTRLVNDRRSIRTIDFAVEPDPDHKFMRLPAPDFIPTS